MPAQDLYNAANVVNLHSRPTRLPNLWVSAPTDFQRPETLTLSWDRPQDISGIQVLFDSALHFHFTQSWQGYPVSFIPSIIRDYRLIAIHPDGSETTLADIRDNHQRNRLHDVEISGVTALRLECLSTHGLSRAQVYAVRVMGT